MHSVHFKGCNVGKAPAFLTKFQEALGGNVMVTAPKHFHGLRDVKSQTMTYPNAGSVPTITAARQAAFGSSITGDSVFDQAHDYHWFERFGYASFVDFFVGYTRSHRPKQKGLPT